MPWYHNWPLTCCHLLASCLVHRRRETKLQELWSAMSSSSFNLMWSYLKAMKIKQTYFTKQHTQIRSVKAWLVYLRNFCICGSRVQVSSSKLRPVWSKCFVTIVTCHVTTCRLFQGLARIAFYLSSSITTVVQFSRTAEQMAQPNLLW